MDSPRHTNTYSGSVEVGKRDNWLVGWQAMEEAAIAGNFRQLSAVFQEAKLTRTWPMSWEAVMLYYSM
jgi:hypothetical protein